MTILLLFIQLCFVSFAISVEWIASTVKAAFVTIISCCEDEERTM